MAVIYPLITADKVGKWLKEEYPVWYLKWDGTLIAANSLALWVWGVILLKDEANSVKDLSNLNIYSIFVGNFTRIPIEEDENLSFYENKSAVIKRRISQHGELPPFAAFKRAMRAEAVRREIYEKAKENLPEWRHTLKIKPSEEIDSVKFLEFETSVSTVVREDDSLENNPLGFVARYEPRGETRLLLPKIYEQLSKKYDIIPYFNSTIHEGGEYVITREQDPKNLEIEHATQQKASRTKKTDIDYSNYVMPNSGYGVSFPMVGEPLDVKIAVAGVKAVRRTVNWGKERLKKHKG